MKLIRIELELDPKLFPADRVVVDQARDGHAIHWKDTIMRAVKAHSARGTAIRLTLEPWSDE